MTVDELIRALKREDPNAPVWLNVWRDDEETIVGVADSILKVSSGVAIRGDEF